MGMRDALCTFSDSQAITVDADSTNVYDTQSTKGIAGGNPIRVEFTVNTTFDSSGDAATLQVNLAEGSATTLGTTVATSGVIAEATLVAGYTFDLYFPSTTTARYIGVEYDNATEAFTAGAITAKAYITH